MAEPQNSFILDAPSDTPALFMQWTDEGIQMNDILVMRNCFAAPETISGSFEFELLVSTTTQYNPEVLCDQSVYLGWYGLDSSQYLSAFVIHAEELSKKIGNQSREYTYSLRVASPLKNLQGQVATRVFVQETPDNIIRNLLQEQGWASSSIDFKLKNAYPARPLTLQYEESDLAFIENLAAQYGFMYTLARTATTPTITFTDDIETLPVPAPLAATVTELHQLTQVLPELWAVSDYNLTTPSSIEAQGKKSNTINASGRITHPILQLFDTSQGSHFAQVLQDHSDSQRALWYAVSNSRSLVPGQIMTLTQEDGSPIDLRILAIHHALDQSGSQLQYHNQLLLIPALQAYAPKPQRPQRFPYVSLARIETAEKNSAHLNDQGYYRLRLGLDDSNTQNGSASNDLAALHGQGGANYGLHYPLLNGTLIAIGYLHGDLNRPFILGAIPDDNQANTLTSSEGSQHQINTRVGHSFNFDDQANAPTATLASTDNLNHLQLKSGSELPLIHLNSTQGPSECNANQQGQVLTLSRQTEQGNNSVSNTTTNTQQLTAQTQDITHAAGQDLGLNSNVNLEQQINKDGRQTEIPNKNHKNIQQTGSKAIAFNSTFNATQTKQTWLMPQGGMNLTGLATASMCFNQGQGLFTLDASGNTTSTSPSHTLNAQTVNAYSSTIVNPTASTSEGSVGTGAQAVGMKNQKANLAADKPQVATASNF